MKLFFQILFFFLTWFTGFVNATSVFGKVVLPSYEFTFSKIEKVKEESVVKIGVQNFARSGIENKFSSILKEDVWASVACFEEEVELVNGAGRHANWVEITDISNKVDNLIPHVLKVETEAGNFITKTIKKNGVDIHLEGFQGCHTENALKEYVQTHGGTYEVRNPSVGLGGVYDGQPVIKLNGKEYVKTNGAFVEYEAGKWGGTSTFFPKEWPDARILEEVKHAVANNHGLVPGQAPGGNLMFGFSKDGVIEIRFAFNANGKGTYYAIKK